MSTTVPIPEVRQFLTDPEGTAFRSQYVEPKEDPLLPDEEEEEMLQLWAGDPGNQGA